MEQGVTAFKFGEKLRTLFNMGLGGWPDWDLGTQTNDDILPTFGSSDSTHFPKGAELLVCLSVISDQRCSVC